MDRAERDPGLRTGSNPRGLRYIPRSVVVFLDRVNQQRAEVEQAQRQAQAGLETEAWVCRRRLRWGVEAAFAWAEGEESLRGLLAMRLFQEQALFQYRRAWLKAHGLDETLGEGRRPLRLVHTEHTELALDISRHALQRHPRAPGGPWDEGRGEA